MAPPLRAVVAQVVAEPVVAAVRPAALLEVVRLAVVAGRAHLAHKLLPLVRLQVAVVLAPRPPEAEVVALLLGQGLAASESLGSR